MRYYRIVLMIATLVILAGAVPLWFIYKAKIKKLWMKILGVVCAVLIAGGVFVMGNTIYNIYYYVELPELPLAKVVEMVREEREPELDVLQQQGLIITGCELGGVSDTENGTRYYFRVDKGTLYGNPVNKEVKERLQQSLVRGTPRVFSLGGLLTQSSSDDDDTVEIYMDLHSIQW